MKKAAFKPSTDATTYGEVRAEAFAFYKAGQLADPTRCYDYGTVCRLAECAAKRWLTRRRQSAQTEAR